MCVCAPASGVIPQLKYTFQSLAESQSDTVIEYVCYNSGPKSIVYCFLIFILLCLGIVCWVSFVLFCAMLLFP